MIKYKENDVFLCLFLILFGVYIGINAYVLNECYTIKSQIQLDCRECHKRVAFSRYFESKGNPTPEQMAEAVLSTKSPRLLAAIATKGEHNSPFWVRKGGYKGRHAGAWQMSKGNEKAYGPVPYDAVGQALQAEKLLVDLTNEMPIEKALNQYGGDSTNKYSNRVLAEIINVP